jgi:pimeloyl-ACP methyl ester carboxylesterase
VPRTSVAVDFNRCTKRHLTNPYAYNPFGSGEDKDRSERNPILEVINFNRGLLSLETEDLSLAKTSLETPVFIGHGEADEKVKYSLGDEMSQTIKLLGMDVTWKAYPNQGHWYKIPDEIDDILEFLREKAGYVTERYSDGN